jgi:DNA invertase Pin-like site-specific DNA recombinase
MMLGYCSVSIFEPTTRLESQRRELAAIGASTFFCEKIATLSKAPELERAIDLAQKGDVIVVTKPYRIAYSGRRVLAIIDRLGRKGAGLRILNTPIDTSTTTGRMILGSVPSWSLGMSPLRSMLWDLGCGWWRKR